MKRKCIALIMAMMMLFALVVACAAPQAPETPPAAETGQDPDPTPAPEVEAADDGLSVLFLVHGHLGDRGFTDATASGFFRLRDELGWNVRVVEMGLDPAAWESFFLEESESGEWDVIAAATFSMKDLVETTAAMFPEQVFFGIDFPVNWDVVTEGNALGLEFFGNHAGFLGGALAALMLETDHPMIDPENSVVGFLGAMDVPNINDFLIGFIDGINYINPDVRVLTSYAGSFSDIAAAYEVAMMLYSMGAQIVYAPAAGGIMGAVQASSDSGGLFIACDNDVWYIMSETDPNVVRYIISSTMKNMGDAIFTMLTGYAEGRFVLGENHALGVAEGAVGLADNQNFREHVPANVIERLDEVAQSLAAGEITVGSAFGMDAAAVAALRDGMAP